MYTESGGKQRPAYFSSLYKPFYIRPETKPKKVVRTKKPVKKPPQVAKADTKPKPPAAPKPAAQPTRHTPPSAPPKPVDTAKEAELLYWESIKDSDDAAFFEAYLNKYPREKFADLAQLRVGKVASISSQGATLSTDNLTKSRTEDNYSLNPITEPKTLPINPNDSVYIVIANDGIYESRSYPGSGLITSQVLRESFAKRVYRIEVGRVRLSEGVASSTHLSEPDVRRIPNPAPLIQTSFKRLRLDRLLID